MAPPTNEWGHPFVAHGTNKGGPSSRGGGGGMGEQCTRTHCQGGNPSGGGATKTHCTAMDPVAANRRLNASDFRVDGAKSPEILQKEAVLGSDIPARNRKSLATFHRTLKSQCSIAFSCLGNHCDFWGPRWTSQSQIAKIAAISVC